MTFSKTQVDHESGGSFDSVFATIDITSLDSANYEPFDPTSDFNLRDVLGVSVIGLEEPENYIVQYDHLQQRLYVEGYGGTDPTATTDVGEVVVRIDGNLGP